MNSLSVNVTNGKIMTWTQQSHDGNVTIQAGERVYTVSAGELVMLANYFVNCKRGIEQSDYIASAATQV